MTLSEIEKFLEPLSHEEQQKILPFICTSILISILEDIQNFLENKNLMKLLRASFNISFLGDLTQKNAIETEKQNHDVVNKFLQFARYSEANEQCESMH